MTEPLAPTTPPPPTLASLDERLTRALEAFRGELGQVAPAGPAPAATPASSSKAGDRLEPGESGVTSSPGAAAAALTPAPGTDDSPADPLQAWLTESVAVHVVEGGGRAVELLLDEMGVERGVDEDSGAAMLKLRDGTEHKLDFEGLLAARVPETLLASRGKSGSGIVEGSRVPGVLVDEFDEALRSQEAFQRMGQRRFIAEYARRWGGR
jgi:hypothetical protein